MRTEKFTGEVSAELRLDTKAGLAHAIGLIVPQDKRRRVLGYKLASVEAISGDALKKAVTIAVMYQ
jgi:hypothetical protein